MEKNQYVKIFKNATQMSIMHVSDMLDYRKTKNNEDVYKGKISFTITETKYHKNQAAYVDKDDAKLLAFAILHNKMTETFPAGNAEFFGGSEKNGVIEARKISVKKDLSKDRYIFSISAGKGERTSQGGFKIVQADPKKSVQNYASKQEAMKLALELLDYIHQREMVAMEKGTPLYTISTFVPVHQSEPTNSEPDFKTFSVLELKNFIKGIDKESAPKEKKILRNKAILEYNSRRKEA